MTAMKRTEVDGEPSKSKSDDADRYGVDPAPCVSDACADLKRLKAQRAHCFLSDGVHAERLPNWVTKSKQTTDGHLMQLASACGATFATLDAGIPGALLIPELPRATEVREPRPAYRVAA